MRMTLSNIFTKLATFVILMSCTTFANAISVNDKVSPANTNGANINVRDCASTNNTTCPILYSVPVGTTGTVLSGGTIANGYTWWKIRWDNGAFGWSADAFLQTLADNPPSLGTVSIVSSARVSDRVCLEGDAKDDWNLTKVGVKINGSTLYDVSVSGIQWPMSGYCFTPSSAGTYSVDIYASDIKNTTTKTLYVNVTSPIPPDSPPSFSGVTTSYNFRSPGNIYFSGTILDDKTISSVQVYSTKSGATEKLIYQRQPNSSTYSLSNFTFSTSDASYYTGAGNYAIRIVAIDSTNQATTQYLSVTVTQDNSARIAELKSLINANNQKKAANSNSVNTLTSQNNTLNTNITNNTSTYNQYSNTLNGIPNPGPDSVDQAQNKASIPDGCVYIGNPSIGLPIQAGSTYQAIAKCYTNSKGSLYFATGYKKFFDSDTCASSSSGLYPAAVIYIQNDIAPSVQKVTNLDQATFWLELYKTALDTNLDSAVASFKQQKNFDHPSEAQLKAAFNQYTNIKIIYDEKLTDIIYEVYGDIGETGLAKAKAPLIAALSSNPYIEKKTSLINCGSENLIIDTSVDGLSGYSFVVPDGVFNKLATGTPYWSNSSNSVAALKSAQPILSAAPTVQAASFTSGAAGVYDLLKQNYNDGQLFENVIKDILNKKDETLNLTKNTLRAVSEGFENRIVDFYRKGKFVWEAKNVKRLFKTAQIKDYIEIAKKNGTKLRIYINAAKTRLSSTIIQAVEAGEVEIASVSIEEGTITVLDYAACILLF